MPRGEAVPSPHHRAGSGPPVVLLHGLGQTWLAWHPVLSALEARCEVLAPTLAGHWGARPTGGEPPEPDLMADEVERWMDREHVGRVHLVGHSIGAWVALELTRRGRALSTVALCPCAAWPTTVHERLRMFAGLTAAVAVARLLAPCGPSLLRPRPVRRALMWWAVHDVDHLPAELAADELTWIARGRAYATTLRLMVTSSGLRPFDGSAHDIHAVWAERDIVVPLTNYLPALHHRIGPVRHTVLGGCGHLVLRERPQAVADLVLDAVLGTPERRRRSLQPPGDRDDSDRC